MRPEKLDAIQQLRNLSDGMEGGSMFALIAVLFLVVVMLASLFWLFAAPIVLIGMNKRLKSIERQLDQLTNR